MNSSFTHDGYDDAEYIHKHLTSSLVQGYRDT